MTGNYAYCTFEIYLWQGFAITDEGIKLISDIISETLGLECAVMMGANLAGEVANEMFCESTIGKSLILRDMENETMRSLYFLNLVL